MHVNKHLSDADFRRLLEGELDRNERKNAQMHLVACDRCTAAFLEYDEEAACSYLIKHEGFEFIRRWRGISKQDAGLPVATVPLDLETIVRVQEELERHDPRQWQLLTRNRRLFQSPEAVFYLLQTARDQWNDDPKEAEQRLQAALGALKRDEIDPRLRSALFAKVYAYFGNIQRIFGRHLETWAAIDEARVWADQSDLGAGFAAEFAWFEGGLLRDGRRLAEAIDRLEFALESVALDGGEEARQEVTVTLGITYGEAGRLDDAIRTLEGVLSRHSKADLRPEVYLAAMQSLALRYVHVGRVGEARAMLHDIRDVAEELGQEMNLLRVTWFEAEVCHAEGNRLGAAMRYREVQEGFMAKGIPYDAALATLSLAELHLEHDDTAAAAELAEELVPIFESKGIHREATAAGLILAESLRREQATVEQVRQVAETVRSGRGERAER